MLSAIDVPSVTPARAASLMGDHLTHAEQEQECEDLASGGPTGTVD
jgi:hypothetical protein